MMTYKIKTFDSINAIDWDIIEKAIPIKRETCQ